MDFPKTFESTFFTLGQLGSQVIDLAYDYLIGSARRLLRNRKSFHASIALLCEAAMERVVLPYNDGETYDEMGLLSLRYWDYFFYDGGYAPLQYLTLLGNDLKRGFISSPYRIFYDEASRAEYPKPVRFSPFQYWDALIDTVWQTARTHRIVSTAASYYYHDNYFAVDIYPPCIHPLNNELSGGFDDIQTTGYFYNQSEFEAQIGNRRVVELQEMETGSPSLTMQMLTELINEAWWEIGVTSFIWDKYYDKSLVEFVEQKLIELTPGEEVDVSWIRRCICKGDDLKNYPIPYTARANINLLPLMQLMLACHWANWARFRPELTAKYKRSGTGQSWLIHADGSVEFMDEYPIEYETEYNRLEWSRRVESTCFGKYESDFLDVEVVFSITVEELARTCPNLLRTREEIEHSIGWEFEIPPEARFAFQMFIIGDRPNGLKEDGTVDLDYFEHQRVTVSVTSEIVVPEGDIHVMNIDGKIVDYPASALIDEGRVKSIAFASALVIDDKFYGYEENEDKDGYEKTRVPDPKGPKARLIVKKSNGQVSAETLKGLIKEFSDSAKAEGNFIGDLEMLPLHDPVGMPASVEGLDGEIPDAAWGWYMTMSDLEVGDKYAPYEFVLAGTGETVTLDQGRYTFRRSSRVMVKTQSVPDSRISEHFHVKFPYDGGAIRAEWNWKAMPVNWR